MTRVSRVFTLIFLLALCLSGVSANGADGVAGKKELQRIKREMREKKKALKRTDRQEHSILSELDAIDRNIQTTTAELADQRQRLRDAEAALREVEQRNAAFNQELAALKQHYSRRVRALYKMSRGGYATALFSPDGLGPTLKRITYLGMVAKQDRTVMREYDSALARLAARQAEVAEKKNELLVRRSAVEAKKSECEARRSRRAGLLAEVRRKKSLYAQSLRELEEASSTLWASIKKNQREKRAARPSAPGRDAAADRNRPRLPWPLDGPVLTRFGMQRHPQFGTMIFRHGIEIQAKEGEPVRAVRDGQVVFADWYKGYGKLIILDHGNGFYTLYGNLSRLDLSKGGGASGGQVIGLSGDTGSLKGSKLYFEIRLNGEPQDPLAWLSRK